MKIKRLIAAFVLALTASACDPEVAIRLAFWEHGEAVQNEAIEVARCESGLNPEARNYQYKGLFQLGHYHTWRFGDSGIWYNAFDNAVAAETLYEEQGWTPWSGCR
jgi:hypothetical protein